MGSLPLRPAAALLSRSALAHNLSVIKRQIRERPILHSPKAEIMAMVKADAYGHDLNRVLPELQKKGIKHFAVASLEEGLQARSLSSSAKILVLGGTLQFSTQTLSLIKKNRFQMAVSDLKALKFFSTHSEIPIHLKLDTGMNRLGLRSEDWSAAIELLKKSNRKLEGLFTHYATSQDPAFYSQAQLFEEATRWFLVEGFRPKYIHSENSAALLSKNSIRKGILSEVANLVRPGISLYGYYPRNVAGNKLMPILELVSEVGLVKPIEVGEGISYGHLYRAKQNQRYGIVTLGYADGLSKTYASYLRPEWRSSTGKNKGLLNICGAICMDMVMVRAMSGELKAQDRVVFWGRFPNEVLKQKLVEPYELNLRISKRIPRIWVP
ncbi:MAG: Alanine racemase [Bacteriovoracaceae bacterium]|nr:Alanine racemase [Bacteriovoracaceae bacterium]